MASTFAHDPDYAEYCRQQLQDPYPLFARLREEDPVHWCEPMKVWLVTRYDDVLGGLKETRRLASSRDGMYSNPLTPENLVLARPIINHIQGWMQNLNPPDHTRIRKLVNLAFTPRMVLDLAPRIEVIVDELLGDVCRQKECDFHQSFCFPLPSKVISYMLGIPAQEQDRLHRTLERLFPFSSGAGPGLNDAVLPGRKALDELLGCFARLIDDRIRDPQNDLISEMAHAESDGERLSREELFGLCVFLYNAGHETTVSLLSSGTMLLLQHPDQFDLLRSDVDNLVESAVEEFLRFESPVTRAIRTPVEPFSFGHHEVPRGETIMMHLGAANRDPQTFPDPDKLDITRRPNKHIAFGQGIHYCLGAPLARLEGKIGFRALAERLPTLRLATDQLRWRSTAGMRSLVSLPVKV